MSSVPWATTEIDAPTARSGGSGDRGGFSEGNLAASRGAGYGLAALAFSAAIAICYWAYWTVFPGLAAGAIGNDALFLADGARRIAAGQIPHVDFSLPTGVEPYLSYLWAERLFPQFSPYIGSHLLGFLLLVPLLAAAASQIPGRLASSALVAVVAMASLLPFNIMPADTYGVSFYASYNRLGTALALVYLAWLFRAGGRPAWLDGLVIAYALLLTFFLKVVFLAVIFGPVVVFALFENRWRLRAVLALAFAGAILLAIQATTGLVSAYIADVREMTVINAGGAVYFFASFIFKTVVPQLLVGLLVLWLLVERSRDVLKDGAGVKSLAGMAQPLAMIAAVGALILAESQSTGGLAFTGALGLLFAPGLVGRPAEGPRLVVLVAALSLIGGTLVTNSFENAMGVLLQRKGPTIEVSWVGRFLPHTVVPETMLRAGEATAALWTEGAETLRRLEAAGHDLINRSDPELYIAQWKTVDTALQQLRKVGVGNFGAVVTLSNVDFFGIALRAVPTRGMKVVHDVGRTIGPLTPEEAGAYLAGADTVFEPTCTIDQAPGRELLAAWFAQVLASEFTPQVLTPCWTMHSRTSSS